MVLTVLALVFTFHQAASVAPLNIPDGSTILMTARAEGVEVYDPIADPNSPTGLNWIYRRPEALASISRRSGSGSIAIEFTINW